VQNFREIFSNLGYITEAYINKEKNKTIEEEYRKNGTSDIRVKIA